MQQNQSGTAPEGLPEDQSTGHTLREIADAIGVDKSTVFRYVQRCGIAPIDATQRCKRYSATAENDIIQHFATMRNDPATMHATMRERLAMMRNSSGNDACNDAQSVQRCSATTPDSSGELDAIRAELDRVTAERDQLRQRLDDQSARHAEQLERIQTAAAEERRELNAGHRQELDRLRQELDDLRRELSTEREHSRATAEKLAQLTDQAQQLQAAQIQRASAPLLEATDDQTEDARPSLWARIFGKK